MKKGLVNRVLGSVKSKTSSIGNYVKAAALTIGLGASLNSSAQFYGDQVLKPDEAPFYKSQGKEHLDFYGSGDADGNDTLDFRDYSAMSNNTKNDRTDVNGDGVTNSSDAALFKKYLDHDIKYLPGHWKYLQTRAERESWVEKMLKIDKTNERKWTEQHDCDGFSEHLYINFAGVEKISSAGISFSVIDTADNARFNIPMYRVTDYTSSGVPHRISGVLVGDSFANFNDWYFIEPQNDSKVSPGDVSMNKDKTVRIDRMGLFRNRITEDTTHGYMPLVTFELDNGKPSLKFANPDAKTKRELVPINFNNIIIPNDTLINYTLNQNDFKMDSLKNLYKDDKVTIIDSSGQIMNKGFEQVNFDLNRSYSINRGLILDTLLKQTINVRDLEAPKFNQVQNLVEPYNELTKIDSNYLNATDNSNLPLELVFNRNSSKGKDSTKLDYYEYVDSFFFSATDLTGNKADTSLERKVLKPNTLVFKNFPTDIKVKGDTSITSTGMPLAIDTLMKSNNVNVTYEDKALGHGFYERTFTATGQAKGDTIKATQLIEDTTVGMPEISNKDNTPAYPNPTNSITNAVFDANYSGNARVELWGMGGQKLEDKKINVKSGENTLPVDLSQYSDGMYLFRIFDKDGNLIEDNKLIKN